MFRHVARVTAFPGKCREMSKTPTNRDRRQMSKRMSRHIRLGPERLKLSQFATAELLQKQLVTAWRRDNGGFLPQHALQCCTRRARPMRNALPTIAQPRSPNTRSLQVAHSGRRRDAAQRLWQRKEGHTSTNVVEMYFQLLKLERSDLNPPSFDLNHAWAKTCTVRVKF